MTNTYIVNTQATWIRTRPAHEPMIGRRDSQLLFGEAVRGDNNLYQHWIAATSAQDGYEGWVSTNDVRIKSSLSEPTHIIATRMANLYPSPTFKIRPSLTLTFMAQVKPKSTDLIIDGFVGVRFNDGLLWVPQNHIMAKADALANPADIVDTAKMFLGDPYLYGGRGHGGIDCSGLVQIALQRNGIACPRDADMQENVVGESVPISLKNLRRGDIVYFPGHVGIMVNRTHMINATARFMQVVIEPVRDVKKACGDTITAVRRLPPLVPGVTL